MSKITNYISNQKPSKIIIIITISVILITLILALSPIFTDILLIINIIFSIILSWNIITEKSLIQETSLRAYEKCMMIHSFRHCEARKAVAIHNFFIYNCTNLTKYLIIFNYVINLGTSLLILLGQGDNIIITNFFSYLFIVENPFLSFIFLLIIELVFFFSIVKGLEKVTEVTAKFFLDALPIKAMARDADLNSGTISIEEAIQQSMKLHEECDFIKGLEELGYFLKEYFFISIIISLVDFIAGIIIRTVLQNETLSNSLNICSTYTIGASLCFLIPIIIITISLLVLATNSNELRKE